MLYIERWLSFSIKIRKLKSFWQRKVKNAGKILRVTSLCNFAEKIKTPPQISTLPFNYIPLVNEILQQPNPPENKLSESASYL
jgi:hypothetical protein